MATDIKSIKKAAWFVTGGAFFALVAALVG